MVDEEFCTTLEEGDSVLAVAATGRLRRIPADVRALVDDAVSRAGSAFMELTTCPPDSTTRFFESARRRLADDEIFAVLRTSNELDVADAASRGRSTTRLILSDKMRADMVEAFAMWRDSPVAPNAVIDTLRHEGWTVEQWRAPLGVVAFVFEGRPNVFADATGVLKSGNTVVFRIGSDALRTARSIMDLVIEPALEEAGLPPGSVVLLDSPEHAAGWCLFSDRRVSLAVARGSGEAVAELGSIAQQAGVPVSLHGTGGAWMITGSSADPDRLEKVVEHSLDRKVCNTLNVITMNRDDIETLGACVLRAAARAARTRGARAKVHVVSRDGGTSEGLLTGLSGIGALVDYVEVLDERGDVPLGHEHEWENDPEFWFVVVNSVEDAVDLFNSESPQFIVSVISSDHAEVDGVWRRCNAPFMGDGFTRWVDGQFALLRPELGLSNWQNGRLLSRSGILSGDSAHSIRLRVSQSDPGLHR